MTCLVGKPAPHFKVKAAQGERILEELSLSEYLGNMWFFFSILSILRLYVRQNFTPFKKVFRNLKKEMRLL